MTAIALNLQSLAQLSSERILNSVAEGVGIAVLAWVLLRALGRQNSGTRFAVWFAALLGIAALPLFGAWTSSGAGLAKPSEIIISASWALYIFAAWLVIAGMGLVRVGMGFWRLHCLRKTCVPVDVAALDSTMRKTLEEFNSSRPVKLCVSDQLQVPTAIGFVKPLVVIPSWAMQDLSIGELNAILLHELAHLRRRDDWTNVLQKILAALLFFHPVVWFIERKLALEREMACDDLVLAKTASPRAYAECLVSLAEKSFLRRGLSLAQAAVDRARHISLRVSQILDVNRPSTIGVWRPAPALLVGVTVVCLMALSYTPRLVSFENDVAASPLVGNGVVRNGAQVGRVAHNAAQVIPAKLDVRSEVSVPLIARSVVPKSVVPRSVVPGTSKPVVVTAKADQREMVQSMPIRGTEAVQAVAPRTLILVMRTEFVQTRFVRTQFVETGGYEGSGSVVWNLCVWQVTVIGPVQNRTQQENTAKSI
jgi:beta-lactamase regulating signal transducer with metallopeptidase domain